MIAAAAARPLAPSTRMSLARLTSSPAATPWLAGSTALAAVVAAPLPLPPTRPLLLSLRPPSPRLLLRTTRLPTFLLSALPSLLFRQPLSPSSRPRHPRPRPPRPRRLRLLEVTAPQPLLTL